MNLQYSWLHLLTCFELSVLINVLCSVLCGLCAFFSMLPFKQNYPQVIWFFVALFLMRMMQTNSALVHWILVCPPPLSSTVIEESRSSCEATIARMWHLINFSATWNDGKYLSISFRLNKWTDLKNTHLARFGILAYRSFVWCGQLRGIVVDIQNPNAHRWMGCHSVIIYRRDGKRSYEQHLAWYKINRVTSCSENVAHDRDARRRINEDLSLVQGLLLFIITTKSAQISVFLCTET